MPESMRNPGGAGPRFRTPPSGGPLEREVQLAVDMDFELLDLGEVVDVAAQLATEQLHAAYFDPPDLRLLHRGIPFRHRMDEGAAEPASCGRLGRGRRPHVAFGGAYAPGPVTNWDLRP